MSASEQTLRRNFIVAAVMHAVLIGGILFSEGYLKRTDRSAATFVDLVAPDILGDLPKGPGQGRGAYTPPAEPAQASVGPAESALAADERPAPAPQTKTVSKVADVPGEIKIPKKTVPVPQKKVATAKPVTKAKTMVAASTAPVTTTSANEFRKRFSKALEAAGDGSKGTPYGDNKAAGGGTGAAKYGHLGSPDGTIDGVPGGIGKGSPFWSYYLHVHDKMYEAWEQPGKALNWDKNLIATIMIRVARDGKILEARVANSSGNKLMDDSALAAARRVERLNALPDGLGNGSYADISVNFEMEG